ncbi:MAG: XRE family transcriptional regulator [Bacteroidetes bacterium]|nr:MAG: XRE family transcriptional regulator [Bacteroidota bacterium]
MIRLLLIASFLGTMTLLAAHAHRTDPVPQTNPALYADQLPAMPREHFGLLAARWRRTSGLSIGEAAARTGLSPAEWRQLEEGSLIPYGELRTELLQHFGLTP